MKTPLLLYFIVLLSFLNITKSDLHENQLRKKQTGFFFTAPRTLTSGTNETVCLSIHEAAVPCKVRVALKIKEEFHHTDKHIHSEQSCFQMYIPVIEKGTVQTVGIRVQAKLNGEVYSAHSQDPILVYPSQKITFIQTDRGIYKPGDKIKIRLLVLDNESLVPPKNYHIPEVRIKNPYDISVHVWENETTDTGLLQLEHQMSRDTIAGKWKIEANGEVKFFEVGKYNLPRFKVYITSPRVIFYQTPKVLIKICSKYTYGKPVQGNAFIKVSDSHHNMQPVQRLQKMINGCSDFLLTNDQLNLNRIKQKYSMFDPRIYLHITASVTEYGTDKIELETAKSLVYLKEYNMKFMSDNKFQPGLPYKGKLVLTNIAGDVKNEMVEICYNIAIKKSWNYLNNEQCSNFTVKNTNVIYFNILPLKNSVIHMRLTARSTKYNIGDSLLVVRLYSQANQYLTLEDQNKKQSCDRNQQFGITYSAENMSDKENITYFYMVKSRNQLSFMKSKTVTTKVRLKNYTKELDNLIGEPHKYCHNVGSYDKFILSFKLDKQIVSKYQLIVYFVHKSGEIVSAVTEVNREPCLIHKVETNWALNQVYPGDKATLNIQTSSDSLCAVSSVDVSSQYIGHSQFMTGSTLMKTFNKEQAFGQSTKKNCVAPPRKNNKQIKAPFLDRLQKSESDEVPSENDWNLKRRKRYVYSFSEDFDAYDVINDFRSTVVTNLKMITKSCYSGPAAPPTYNDQSPSVLALIDQYNTQNEEKKTSVRSLFPETWLWELTPVKKTKQLQRSIPHTITNWATNVMCVSPTEGVGLSEVADIKTFQPFFIEMLVPYSVKRDEIFNLQVIVFNYMNYSIPIRITLGSLSGIRLLSSSMSASYCIMPDNTITHVYQMMAQNLGESGIKIVGEIDSSYPGQCGPETVVNTKDVVSKTVLVEPEGYPIKITKSALICDENDSTMNNVTWLLQVPPDIIPGTAKAKLSINGDLMGQSLENLEELLTIPTGCGEQITASMAPNLYILQYLTATNSLTQATRQRIIKNMKMGYQRILSYAHKDGSFSAFGYHDTMGSMFLTTFVVRTLQEASKYIYVDQKVVDKAVSWILANQLENGCFSTMLHVFQDMGVGTKNENSTSALTSYVILSLLEAQVEIPELVLTNAKYCIRGYSDPDTYTLAISCYALHKIKWVSEAESILKRLLNIAKMEQNLMWWTTKDDNGSIATDIEVTSYVLLALLESNSTANLASAHAIVRWLTTKKGPNGGFKSTQDTVVALHALSKYAILVGNKEVNLDVVVNAQHQSLHYKIKNEDRLKSRKINLRAPDNDISISVHGQGCLLAQSVLSYYVRQISHNQAFKLAMDVGPVSTIDQCSIAMLSPCIAYTGPEAHSNMAVLEVTLPSGYEADRASLFRLTDSENDTKVKMFEEIKNSVVLYFTKVDKEETCVTFNIIENALVQNRLESVAKLYDYYKPEFQSSFSYNMHSPCQGNVTLVNQAGNLTDVNVAVGEKSLSRRKRQNKLNPTFTDTKVDLDVPDGLEGNKPVFVKPSVEFFDGYIKPTKQNKKTKYINKLKRSINNGNVDEFGQPDCTDALFNKTLNYFLGKNSTDQNTKDLIRNITGNF